jgi:hypothetical protein
LLIALEDAVLELVQNPDRRRRAWLTFTDDVSLPEECEPLAELAFEAGYGTAMQHVGMLLGAIPPLANR